MLSTFKDELHVFFKRMMEVSNPIVFHLETFFRVLNQFYIKKSIFAYIRRHTLCKYLYYEEFLNVCFQKCADT